MLSGYASRFAFCLLAFFVVASSCKKKESEEDRVRVVVRAALAAVHQKDAGGVLKNAAEGFIGPNNSDGRECRRILLGFFLRQGWIRAFEKSLDVTVQGDSAKAKLSILLGQGEPVENIQDLLPTNATSLLFDLSLERADGDWKFSKASYAQQPL